MIKLIEEFVDYLLVEKNMSTHTAYNYRLDLTQFYEFCNKNVKDVTSRDISNFIRSLRLKGMSISTTNRKLSSLKSFFNYLYRVRVVDNNPATIIEGGKMGVRLPKPIDEKDINLMIGICDNLRDRVVLEVLYGTGIRRGELVKLKKSDISFNDNYIRVTGKGNKERIVPIHPYALDLIKRLFEEHGNDWLLPSRKDTSKHLSTRQINDIVRKWADKAGLSHKDITPHKFRHSFCSHLHRNGADIKTIQELAGHSNANTTQIYTKVSNTRNMLEYMKFHPRAEKALV